MCVASFLITLLISCQCDATSSSSPSLHPAAVASSSSSSSFATLLHSSQQPRSRPLLQSLMPVASPSSGSPAHMSGPQVLVARRSEAEARNSLEQLSPKRFFDFLTDPSLLITVLHSLEVAYWTFPFGFILTPVINFFRVPNKRSLESMRKSERVKRETHDRLKMLHLRLLKSMAKAETYKRSNIRER